MSAAVDGSDAPLQVEATGETVGEAKWTALRDLEKLHPGLDKGAVRFQVLSEGERGLLGVGYTPARVVASYDEAAEPPRDESADAALVRELVERIVSAIGIRCRVDVHEQPKSIDVTCSGTELGLLIGKHGQTIDAIQYLANAVLHRQGESKAVVVVDAAGYRARRRATLEALAVRSAQRALASGDRIELEPMSAIERKVVHLRLQDFPGVETESEGAEPNRYVVIIPAE
jgi:spoIIIJ-associated protein